MSADHDRPARGYRRSPHISRFPCADVSWRGLGEAIAFLTCLPVVARRPSGGAELRAAVPWFPVAGAIVGTLTAVACWGGDTFCGHPVGAALAIVAGLSVTGGLHADGLADTVDGLAGAAGDRDRALRIMKDSRVGSLGTASLIGVAVLRLASLSATAPPWRWFGLVSAAIAGRTAIVLALSRFPYARPEGGTGTAFAGRLHPAVVVFVLLTGAAMVYAAGGPAGLLAAAGSVSFALVGAGLIARTLGGLTGDCYGAVCELAEVVFLLFWAVN